MSEFLALQNGAELRAFCHLITTRNVRSYLEIGCYRGGMLWQVASAMPVGSRVMAVDMPGPDVDGRGDPYANLRECILRLRFKGYEADMIHGNSHDDAVVEAARAKGPYDVVFIDGEHSYAGVEADWQSYGPMAKMLVGFHDIAWADSNQRQGGDVPRFWRDLKKQLLSEHPRTQEIRLDDKPQENGIGLVWKE